MADDTLPRWTLRGWLGKVTAARWLRLFLFEFFVILLGVLAAQALQARFADRAERRQAEAIKLSLDEDLRSLALSAEIRLRRQACLVWRMERVEDSIASASRAGLSKIGSPDEALVVDFGWNGIAPATVAAHYDPTVVERYRNAALWARSLERAQMAEQEAWAQIARLSSRLAPVTDADRSAAKAGLVSAGQALRRVGYASGHLLRHAKDAGLTMNPSDQADLASFRRSEDPCQRAVSYTLPEQGAAAAKGRLVTGERVRAFAEPKD